MDSELSEQWLKDAWKEMIRQICWRIREGTIKVELCKYDEEAFVRPFFGDDEEAYAFLEESFEKVK